MSDRIGLARCSPKAFALCSALSRSTAILLMFGKRTPMDSLITLFADPAVWAALAALLVM